jgi:hypothetical protein
MQKWVFDVDNKAVMCESDIVFYIDDLDYEIVTDIVNMHNNNFTPHEIDTYLLDKSQIAQDEREFVIEQIVNYINFINMTEQQVTEISGLANAEETVQELIKTPEATQKKIRKQRNSNGSLQVKLSNPSDYIAILQEKIEIVRILDSVSLPDIPSNLTKANRDIMIDFQKEHEALVAKYMEKIQKA